MISVKREIRRMIIVFPRITTMKKNCYTIRWPSWMGCTNTANRTFSFDVLLILLKQARLTSKLRWQSNTIDRCFVSPRMHRETFRVAFELRRLKMKCKNKINLKNNKCRRRSPTTRVGIEIRKRTTSQIGCWDSGGCVKFIERKTNDDIQRFS